MRRATGLLALAVAITELTLIIVSDVLLRSDLDAQTAAGMGPAWTRLPPSLALALPWIVGGILLLAGRRYSGTVVVVSSAVLTVPEAGVLAAWLVERPASPLPPGGAAQLVAAVLSVGLAVMAGVLAWRRRPRNGWRRDVPTRHNLYTVVAFLAWLPSVLASSQLVLPRGGVGTGQGARRFVEFLWGSTDGGQVMVGLTASAVLATVLVIAPRLRRDAAGPLAMLVGLPLFATQASILLETTRQEVIIATPAGWIGAVGAVGVMVIGVLWTVRARSERDQ